MPSSVFRQVRSNQRKGFGHAQTTCQPQKFKTWTIYQTSLDFTKNYLDKCIHSSVLVAMLFLKTLGCKNCVLEYKIRMENCPLWIRNGCGLMENEYVGVVCPLFPFFWTGNDSGYGLWVGPPKKGEMQPNTTQKGLFGEALLLTTSHLCVL